MPSQEVKQEVGECSNPVPVTENALGPEIQRVLPPISEPSVRPPNATKKPLNFQEIQQNYLRRYRERHQAREANSTKPKKEDEDFESVALDVQATSVNADDDDMEDNSWMDGHEDNSPDGENVRLYQIALEKRMHGAIPSFNDRVELLKVTQKVIEMGKRAELQARNNPRSQDMQDLEYTVPEDEESRRQTFEGTDDSEEDQMFVSDEENTAMEDEEDQHLHEGNDDISVNEYGRESNIATQSSPERVEERPSKRRVGRNAREVEYIRRVKEREKAQKKKARQEGSNRISKSRKKSSKAKSSHQLGNSNTNDAPSAHRCRMRGNRGESALQTIINGLIYNDTIADRAALGDYGDAPRIDERFNKARQFRLLMASVPDDTDMHKSKIDKSDLVRASKSFGFAKVKAENGKWRLKGIKSPLYHHQLIGAHWMIGRELTEIGPKGGLLADAMGLGKTVEMLATIVGNPPSKADIKANRKTTLIILPSSVIKQWTEEISKHIESGLADDVLHYKSSKEIPVKVLQKCDIVLASYTEVMKSFPWPKADEVMGMAAEGGVEAWKNKSEDEMGVLHKVHWYRIVLDEAHAIKNFKCRTSVACQSLIGRYRWALTGTPIQK